MLGLESRKLRYINWLLAGIIIIVNGYVLVSPLLPQFDLWKRQHQTHALSGLPYKTKLVNNDKTNTARANTPSDNRLVIPKLAINEHIYTGTDPYLVNRGVWARPNSSTPPLGSNTVLVAHRFTYSGKSIFYSLDKMTIDDKVVVYWQGKEYDYTVKNSIVVPATQLSVEAPTSKAQLTLYTCTPLWNPKDRLVVTASEDKAKP